MKDELILIYQTVSTAMLALGTAGFAASFTFNNLIANIRTSIYESDAYALVAKHLQSIDGGIDAARPLRILVMLTTFVRFASLVMVIYALAAPKNHISTALFGLALALIWLVLLVLWLVSILKHQRHEVESTSQKIKDRRDATKIDSGLGTG